MYLIEAREVNTRNVLAAFVEIAVLLFLSVGVHGEEPALVIENARVIVGNGDIREGATVVIAEGRIQRISSEAVRLEGVKTVDARGKTLMPGLIDAHIHFGLSGSSREVFREQIEAQAPRYLEDFLRYGVTTVRSMADPLDLILELRQAVEEARIAGPRIVLVGPCFTAPGGHPVATMGGNGAIEVDNVDAAREAVRELAAKDVDAIKAVLEEGHGVGMPDVTLPRLSTEVLRAIVDEAHRCGLKANVHTHREPDVVDAIDCGADGVEHGVCDVPIRDPRWIERMAERNMVYTPTLWIVSALEKEAGWLAIAQQNLKRISDEGVTVCLGTDTLCAMPRPGLNTIQEMEYMAEAGLTPAQVIQAGTRNAAAHLGLLADLGTVEPGKIADLILIDGDPLQDISAMHKVSMVIQAGRIVYEAGVGTATAAATEMPARENPVVWFDIPVTDLARATAFYESVFQVTLSPMKFGPVEMAFFPAQAGARGAPGALVKGSGTTPGPQGVVVYFHTADIDGTLQRARKQSAAVILPKTPIGPFCIVAVIEDSEGNRIGLRSPP